MGLSYEFAFAVASLLLICNFHQTTGDDTITDYLCANQPPNTRLPHPETCEVYIVCENNRAVEIRCDDDQLFNPETSECDPDFTDCPANAGYGDDDNYVDTDDDEYNENVEENTTTQASLAPQQPTTDVDKNVCPRNDSEQVTFIMNENDCSVYYLCYHGRPTPLQCSMGMNWSNKLKRCVPKEISECGTFSTTIDSGCPAHGIKFMPHPNVCQYFIFCLNGAETIQRCEAFYHWDVNEGKCKLKTRATCYRSLRQALDERKGRI